MKVPRWITGRINRVRSIGCYRESLFKAGCMVALLLVSGGPAQAAPPAGSAWEMIFSDEFNGTTLDLDKWIHESACCGTRRGNAYIVPACNVVQGGILRQIVRNRVGGGFEQGEITSKTFKAVAGYYYEIRCKRSTATGVVSAFWADGSVKPYYEVDFMETWGSDSTNIWAPTAHYWGATHTSSGQEYKAPVDLSKDYHVFGADWRTNNMVVAYFDEKVKTIVSSFNQSENWGQLRLAVSNQSYFGWGPATDPATLPAYFDVDYVRVYRKVATAIRPFVALSPIKERAMGAAVSFEYYSIDGRRLDVKTSGNQLTRAAGAGLYIVRSKDRNGAYITRLEAVVR